MLFQVVIQSVLRRINNAVPTPPKPGEPAKHRDRTGFILVLTCLAVAVAFAVGSAV
jgi:hypothetical protein